MGARKVGDVVCAVTGRAVAVRWDAEWAEYQVGTGAARYHTGSYRDAIGTGFAMVRQVGPVAPVFIGRPHRPAPGHE